MLLDEWMQPSNKMTGSFNYSKYVASNIYKFRRFQMADDVVAQIGKLLKDFPNALLDNYQFALPPYECTYIEFNAHLFFEALTGASPSTRDSGMDDVLGFAIIKNTAFTLVKNNKDNRVVLMPLAFCLNKDFFNPNDPLGKISIEFNVNNFDQNNLHKWFAFILGTTYGNNRTSFTPPIIFDILNRFTMLVDKAFKRPEETLEDINNEILNFCDISTGELRNILAMLLWLNQSKLYLTEQVPASRKWVGKKMVPYAAHNIVRLRPGVTTRKVLSFWKARLAPRRHEVAAHWKNYNKNQNCEHAWPKNPDEKGRFRCEKCSQFRVRVMEFLRGDASKGFVSKEYKILPSKGTTFLKKDD